MTEKLSCFIFLNLKQANVCMVRFRSKHLFQSFKHFICIVFISASTEVRIWIASLPNQFTISPALCLSLRSDSGPSNRILQSALNCSISVSLSWASQSNLGLTNWSPETLDILRISTQNLKIFQTREIVVKIWQSWQKSCSMDCFHWQQCKNSDTKCQLFKLKLDLLVLVEHARFSLSHLQIHQFKLLLV